MVRFPGVYVAIATPFTKEFEVDYGKLREHAEWLISEGVDGFVPTGSCGEYAVLSDQERATVVETLLEVAKGRVEVVVGVAAPATSRMLHWAQHAKDHGAVGVMALPPVLYRPTWDEVKGHYAALDKVGLPIIVYNNPYDTAVDITPKKLAELSKLPNIQGVKEFSGDVRRVTEIRELTDLELIAGTDDLAVESFLAGATGWIAGMANFLPKQSSELFRLSRAGQWDEAWALYRRLLPILRYDSTPRLVQVIKHGMQVIGRPMGDTRPPRLALPEEDRETVKNVLESL